MTLIREVLFAVILLASAAVVTYGVYLIFEPAAYIVGGILVAGWTWLVLSEVD